MLLRDIIKIATKLIISYLPKRAKKYINDLNRQRKKRYRRVYFEISLNQINEILSNFDFKNDIFLHSSMTNFGCQIEGTIQNISDLILSKIDLSEQTLLLPALPFSGSMFDYLEGLKNFNLNKAPNKMGAISNDIMHKQPVVRSFHPTHSVLAIGKDAAYYIKDHEKCLHPFSKNSPYYKHMKNNGKILMFGVNLNSVTSFHVYEDLILDYIPVKIYTKKKYCIPSIKGEKRMNVITGCHSSFMSLFRDCERVRSRLIINNYIQTCHVGKTEISLLDAKGLTIVLLEMLLDDLSIYGLCNVSKTQKKVIALELSKLKDE